MSGRKTKIIAIANQKGGVAKTTTSINISAALALAGLKVLLIDLDPQGNASTGLGVSLESRDNNIYDILINDISVFVAIKKTSINNLDVIPSDINLSAAEIELLQIDNKEFRLKKALSASEIKYYDYVFIDCPPSLGQLTLNALSASDGLIIPLQCEFFALEGLSHLLKSIDIVQKNLNKNLKILGILLSMYDKRNRLTEEVEKDVRDCLKDSVFKTVIPRNIRISEASSHGKPVLLYDPNCLGSKAYHALVREFIEREKLNIF